MSEEIKQISTDDVIGGLDPDQFLQTWDYQHQQDPDDTCTCNGTEIVCCAYCRAAAKTREIPY